MKIPFFLFNILVIYTKYCQADFYLARYCLPGLEIFVTCTATNSTSQVICSNDEDPSETFLEDTIFQIDQPKQIVDFGDEIIHSDPVFLEPLVDDLPPVPNVQVFNNLVLLIEFSNHRNRRTRYSRELYDQILNANEPESTYYPTGSVKSFFENQTYGKIVLQSTVMPWFETNFTEQEAAAGCSSLCLESKLTDVIIQALTYFDERDEINFNTFDNLRNDRNIELVTIITSSRGAETGRVDDLGVNNRDRIWSHRWSLFRTFTSKAGFRVNNYNVNPSLFSNVGNRITRIGVLTHEIFHAFSLPDLYDMDASSAGLSVFNLMSSPWGIDRSQFYPPSLSPWTKEQLELVEFKSVEPGWNIILPSNLNSRGQIYKLQLNQYEIIYIDYQAAIGNMRLHPEGIIIYHCDNRVRTGNDEEWYPGLYAGRSNPYPPLKHYICRIIQKNGLFLLEKQRKLADNSIVYLGNDEGDMNISFNDFGSNNINSWTNLEKLVEGGCVYLGHELTGFSKVGQGQYRFWYSFNEELAGKKCDASLIITDDNETGMGLDVALIVGIILGSVALVLVSGYVLCKNMFKSKYD